LNIGRKLGEPSWGAGRELRRDLGGSFSWVGESNSLEGGWEDSEERKGGGLSTKRVRILQKQSTASGIVTHGSTERFSLGRAKTAVAMAKTVAAVNFMLTVGSER
jgi:hypothetical protein